MNFRYDFDLLPELDVYVPPGLDESMAVYKHALGTPEYRAFKTAYKIGIEGTDAPTFGELGVQEKMTLFDLYLTRLEDDI